jgi:hypothetical protein
MPKQFWQCDVTDFEDNIWTGPVIYGSHQQAEFDTMLELQQDWGDSYMPEAFLDHFGRTDGDSLFASHEPEFPGDEAWDEAGYWPLLGVNTFMLALDPAVALAKLGKLECHLTEPLIEKIVNGEVRAEIGLII